jgi:hypothetical protein
MPVPFFFCHGQSRRWHTVAALVWENRGFTQQNRRRQATGHQLRAGKGTSMYAMADMRRGTRQFVVPQRRKWHCRRHSCEKPHSNRPTLATPESSTPHCSGAGFWLSFGRHSQIWQPALSPGSSSVSIRETCGADSSAAMPGKASTAVTADAIQKVIENRNIGNHRERFMVTSIIGRARWRRHPAVNP